MAETPDLSQEIADAAAAPSRTTVDGVSTEEHNLKDLIAADEHLARKRASRRGGLPFRTLKVTFPGTA